MYGFLSGRDLTYSSLIHGFSEYEIKFLLRSDSLIFKAPKFLVIISMSMLNEKTLFVPPANIPNLQQTNIELFIY